MGDFEIVNMPTDGKLFPVDVLVGHTRIVWINDETETEKVGGELLVE